MRRGNGLLVGWGASPANFCCRRNASTYLSWELERVSEHTREFRRHCVGVEHGVEHVSMDGGKRRASRLHLAVESSWGSFWSSFFLKKDEKV
jgi:hypothetical protein